MGFGGRELDGCDEDERDLVGVFGSLADEDAVGVLFAVDPEEEF
jgi:hypothetical protein